MRLGGRDCAISKHEEDVHTASTGFGGRRLIRYEQPQQPHQGWSNSEEALVVVVLVRRAASRTRGLRSFLNQKLKKSSLDSVSGKSGS